MWLIFITDLGQYRVWVAGHWVLYAVWDTALLCLDWLAFLTSDPPVMRLCKI